MLIRQVEFLTGCFSGRPSDCPVELWDFAYAGSDISSDLYVLLPYYPHGDDETHVPHSLPLHHNITTPLVDQVRQFVDNNVLSIIPKKPDSARLTAWWIGINDTGDILGRNARFLHCCKTLLRAHSGTFACRQPL